MLFAGFMGNSLAYSAIADIPNAADTGTCEADGGDAGQRAVPQPPFAGFVRCTAAVREVP